MSFDPHSPRFDLRRLFPATETDEEELAGGPEAIPFASEEESTYDPARRIIAEALEQLSSERCCVCPLCGAIVGRDGSVLG